MRSNRYIQKLGAALLLGIFILCNTPTRFLHVLFADHIDDSITVISNNGSPVIHEGGIDCHCISNVVNSPYLFTYQPVTFDTIRAYTQHFTNGESTFHPAFYCHFSLRGPPILG